MSKILTMPRKGEKGFTLIELLVVIAILGVIAAVAIPNILNFIGRGETEAMQAELHNVLVAVTAAMSESTDTPPVVVAYANAQIVANPAAAINDAARYLINNTDWLYTVTAQGQVTQGARVP